MHPDSAINEIFNELSECREDERQSQNQIVQVIATAGTMLGVVFGASVFQKDGTESVVINQHTLLWLSAVIFCIAFTYITALGITNVLRYHYMQELEDRVSIFTEERESDWNFIHWMSFSSPITTRHPGHIRSGYTLLHYFGYAIATVSAALFCLGTTILQYKNISELLWADRIAMVCAGTVMALCVVGFFFISIRSQNMYKFAKHMSKTRKKERLERNKHMEVSEKHEKAKKETIKARKTVKERRMWNYLLYPKVKDFQKAGLIVIGFLAGEWMDNGYTGLLSLKEWAKLLLVVFVFDVLIYQARYQWNDIRGLAKDTEEGTTKRIPSGFREKVGCGSIIYSLNRENYVGIFPDS